MEKGKSWKEPSWSNLLRIPQRDRAGKLLKPLQLTWYSLGSQKIKRFSCKRFGPCQPL